MFLKEKAFSFEKRWKQFLNFAIIVPLSGLVSYDKDLRHEIVHLRSFSYTRIDLRNLVVVIFN